MKSISPAIACAVTAATSSCRPRLRREKVNYFVLNDRGVDIENNQILATGLEIALLDGNINRQGRCQLREGPADEIWLRRPVPRK